MARPIVKPSVRHLACLVQNASCNFPKFFTTILLMFRVVHSATIRDRSLPAIPRCSSTDRTSGCCIAPGSNVFKRALNNCHAFSRAPMTRQSKHLYEFGSHGVDLESV